MSDSKEEKPVQIVFHGIHPDKNCTIELPPVVRRIGAYTVLHVVAHLVAYLLGLSKEMRENDLELIKDVGVILHLRMEAEFTPDDKRVLVVSNPEQSSIRD